jgi:hypothetical protein
MNKAMIKIQANASYFSSDKDILSFAKHQQFYVLSADYASGTFFVTIFFF